MSDNLFDDNDDAWSYSFPPSTESLTLSKKDDDNSKLDNELNSGIQRGDKDKDVFIDSDDSRNHTIAQNRSNVHPLLNKLASKKGQLSRTSSTSSVGDSEEPKEDKKDHVQTNGNGSHASSLTSLPLQSSYFVKSTPANPHTTKEDANSIISREGAQGSGFSLDSNFNSQSTPVTSSARSNLSNNVVHDVGELASSYGSRDENSDIDKSKSAKFDNEGSLDSSSPKIITYRKSKRTISEGNFQNILDQSVKATPKEKYDPKLYVEEKFMDTDYRYATTRRTAEFHQLFRSLDLTDRLLDDFSCALSREILLQGRIYISENNVCFSSNLLGWVTSLIIPQEEIIRIEKKTTAGLFPNGISIETASGKHNFASFISRDATFDFMKTIWQGTTGRKMEIIEEKPMEKPGYSLDSNGIVSVENECLDSPAKLESYILSIDGDEERHGDNEYASDHSDSEDTSDDAVLLKKTNSNKSNKRKKIDTVDLKVLKFKPDSKYINMGPDFHPPTKVNDYAKENNETELCNEVINAPLGVVFDLLFGSSNTTFHKSFLESHNASEISDYDKFHPNKDDPSKLERKISYRRALGYSIGPKSTRCEVEETIENLNFAENVVLISSTVTPDVPLGNSFSVKTRYCLSWGANNSTILKISYNIKWTGSSWIKSVIEKQTLAGQQEATKDLVEALKKGIDESTYYAEGPSVPKNVAEFVTENKPTSEITEEIIKSNREESEKKTSTLSLSSRFIKNNIVSIFYVVFSFFVILLILQMKIISGVNEANEIARSQLVVNSYLVFTVQALANDKSMSKARYRERIKAMENDNSPLWKWVNDKYDTKLNNLEKIEYLTYQLNSLYQKQIDPENNEFVANIEENLQDLKRLVKDFNYQELLNADNLRNILGDLL
ncbi:unnamed protein product [Debaryomyces tyrocola]|nr:unnamed protein product [Debaryomyces tyrocola]